ncbi:MAG: type IV pilus secretin PilQ [Gammaproteobacteria bacterium]|nr:type IV pilus secretin PilQ [Gammaproteobacteria bacterium]
MKNILSLLLYMSIFKFSTCFCIENEFVIKNKESDLKKLSLNFQKIETKKAIQYLANIANKNIILSDNINGTLTLDIKNMDWEYAFNLILKVKNLGYRKFQHVLFVAPLSEIVDQQKQEALLEKQQDEYTPLQSEVIEINYAKATELAHIIKERGNSLLSTHGTLGVDSRTNTLILEDHPKKLQEIKFFIKKLDIPVKQVLIEAKIINVDTHYEEALGIKFNTLSKQIPCTDQPKETAPEQIHLDLPCSPHLHPLKSASVALATLDRNTLLDVALSAMESTNAGEILSNPKIITADQQSARIQSGEEIPYQEATSSGATNVSFKKAVLSLEVTPQITPNNHILMSLKINQDKRGQTINGTPSIDTQQIETQVLAENGGTIILGGIYEKSKIDTVERIPFLSQTPIIGKILSNNFHTKQRKELIIFITPTIIPVHESGFQAAQKRL